MADQPLIYQQTFEALLKSVHRSLTPELTARLVAVGLDPSKPLLPGYPRPVLAAVVRTIASGVFPDISGPEAYRLLGRRTVDYLEDSFLGRAQVAMARVVGPMKALMRMPKNVRTAGSHQDCTTRQLDGKTMEMTLTGYVLPYAEFHVGCLEAVLAMFRTEGSVEVLRFDHPKMELEVRVVMV